MAARFLHPTLAYTAEFFSVRLTVCLAQTGYFFWYLLVLGIII
jgi:hypothetical protein